MYLTFTIKITLLTFRNEISVKIFSCVCSVFIIQLTLDNSSTRKLEHLGRSNKFVGPLDEFLSITLTFPYLSEVFQ